MNSYWNLFLFIALYLMLIYKSGRTYPILYLFLFVYFIQYIFSTYLIYNFYGSLRSYMEIGQDRFFDFAIPALFFLFFGILLFAKDFDIRSIITKIDPTQAALYGYCLIGISFLFDIIFVPGLSSFTRYLKYSGAFCFLFSNARLKYFVIVFVYSLLLLEALALSIFIDFFVFSTYLFFFIALKFQISFKLRLLFIIVAFPVLVLVQTVKKEYREATWSGREKAGVDLFRELANKNINKNANKSFLETDGMVRTVGRLCQGWHLGLVLRWVPSHESFSEGKELSGDILGSLIPRAFYMDKKKVGTQDKFLKFTGHSLTKGTSMTIGVLGDFYINFGRTGAFIGLFIFGSLISLFFNFFIKKHVLFNPINIIWIPFFFNYLMRANNDFYMVFNALLKGFFIFLLFNYFWRKFIVKKHLSLPLGS